MRWALCRVHGGCVQRALRKTVKARLTTPETLDWWIFQAHCFAHLLGVSNRLGFRAIPPWGRTKPPKIRPSATGQQGKGEEERRDKAHFDEEIPDKIPGKGWLLGNVKDLRRFIAGFSMRIWRISPTRGTGTGVPPYRQTLQIVFSPPSVPEFFWAPYEFSWILADPTYGRSWPYCFYAVGVMPYVISIPLTGFPPIFCSEPLPSLSRYPPYLLVQPYISYQATFLSAGELQPGPYRLAKWGLLVAKWRLKRTLIVNLDSNDPFRL